MRAWPFLLLAMSCSLRDLSYLSDGGPFDDARAPDASADAAADPCSTPYAKAVLADSPTGYWRLGEMTGSAIDCSPTPANGTYGSAVQRATGSLIVTETDRAASFPGADGGTGAFVTVPANAKLQKTLVSVEFWARPAEIPMADASPNNFYLVTYGNPSNPVWVVQFDDNHHYGTYMTGLGVNIAAFAPFTLPQTDHVVAVYDGALMSVWVNGQTWTAPTTAGDAGLKGYDNIHGLSIGALLDGRDAYHGIIDEVALYDHALSCARIVEHFTIATGTSPVTCANDAGAD